jgi:putative FmdB family regulatory protein
LDFETEERSDMPLYEYECTQCKRHTEKIQKFSDAEITQCPHCGGLLERVVSAPAIAFKGGGWYADGYGNAKPSAAKSEGNDSKSDSAAAAPASGVASGSSGKEAASAAPAAASTPAPAAAAPASSGSEKK